MTGVEQNLGKRRLTFGDSVDRLVVYLLAGLMAWLCLTNLDNRDKLTALLEAKKADQAFQASAMKKMEHLDDIDRAFSGDLQMLQLEAAKHGWETSRKR